MARVLDSQTYFVCKKEKRTSRPLGPAYAPLILIWFWQLLLRKLHQYCIRTKPNRVRKTINMAAASFLSMNHLYCCHIPRQKALLHRDVLPPGLELLNRNCDEIYAERRKQFSITNGRRVWSCFPTFLGCLYTAISNSTPGGCTFKPSLSSSLLISGNFIIRKSWHFFKRGFENITVQADYFDVFSQVLLCPAVVSSPAQTFFIEVLLPAQNEHQRTHSCM